MSCNDCDNPCHSSEPATTPGGLNGQVQYNRSGAFAGAKRLVTDGTGFTQCHITGTMEFIGSGRQIIGDFATTGVVTTKAATAAAAGLILPHGTAPTTPVNGALWSDSTGFYGRVNGVTVGPFGGGGGTPGGSDTQVQFNDAGSFGGDAGLTYDKTTDTLTAVNAETTGLLQTAASSTGSAGLNVPPGTAPAAPVNGDFWSEPTGFYGRVAGTTVGPFSAGASGASADLMVHARLTLTTGVPVTTSDVTGATNVYCTPFRGNTVPLWDGSAWRPTTFTEKTLALGTVVAFVPYDVFGYLNASTLALEMLQWLNATITVTIASPAVVTWNSHGLAVGDPIVFTTSGALPTGLTANTQYFVSNVPGANTFRVSATNGGADINTSGSQSGTHTGHQSRQRGTAVTLQDGFYCKSGDKTRLYLGTFATTSTTQTEDSATKRNLWNYYNRVGRRAAVTSLSSHAYNGGTRMWNASAASQFEHVVGIQEDAYTLSLYSQISSLGGTGIFPIMAMTADALSTAANALLLAQGFNGQRDMTVSQAFFPGVGRRFVLVIESTSSTGSATFNGFYLSGAWPG